MFEKEEKKNSEKIKLWEKENIELVQPNQPHGSLEAEKVAERARE